MKRRSGGRAQRVEPIPLERRIVSNANFPIHFPDTLRKGSNPDPVSAAGSLIAFGAVAGRDVKTESVQVMEPLVLACGQAPGFATGGLLR